VIIGDFGRADDSRQTRVKPGGGQHNGRKTRERTRCGAKLVCSTQLQWQRRFVANAIDRVRRSSSGLASSCLGRVLALSGLL